MELTKRASLVGGPALARPRRASSVQSRLAAYPRCSPTYRVIAASLMALLAGAGRTAVAAEKPDILGIQAMHMVHMSDTTWSLSLTARGQLTVTFRGVDHKSQLSRERVRALWRLIGDEGFFGLHDKAARCDPHYDTRDVVVKTAKGEKRVGVACDIRDVSRDDLHRLLRICIAIRALFDLPEAANATESDRQILSQ